MKLPHEDFVTKFLKDCSPVTSIEFLDIAPTGIAVHVKWEGKFEQKFYYAAHLTFTELVECLFSVVMGYYHAQISKYANALDSTKFIQIPESDSVN